MRLSLVSAVGLALVTTSSVLVAQGPRQLELSLLGGTAHTDRTARLSAEEWIEPYSGIRLDARLISLWGGRVGMAVQLDRYHTGLDGMTSPPCAAEVCAAHSSRLESGLVPIAIRGSDARLLAGASWQRPLTSWLKRDVLGSIGVRRLESETRLNGVAWGQSFPSVQKAVVGAQVGVSTRWHGTVGGAAFEYASGRQWNGVRRAQNRVALRAGYALSLGGQ